MENKELLNILSQLFDEKLETIKRDLVELKIKVNGIDSKLDLLEAGNANKHVILLDEIKDLKEKFERVEREVNRVEV